MTIYANPTLEIMCYKLFMHYWHDEFIAAKEVAETDEMLF